MYSGQISVETGRAGTGSGSWSVEPSSGYVQEGGHVNLISGPCSGGGSANIRCQSDKVKFLVNGGTLEMETNTNAS